MKRLLFYTIFGLSISLLLRQSIIAQTPLAIGQWETLQSYRTGQYVTQSEESIIYSTGTSIFYLDKDDLSISLLTRDDGLAETEIKLIRYHQPTATLIIVYTNSVIDLLQNNRFSTLRQIDNFNFSGGDNSINDIFFGEGNVVYLSAGYGISALDLDDQTFAFTTFTPIPVKGVSVLNGKIFAPTENGVYQVDASSANINDFNNWELIELGGTEPFAYSSSAINVWKNELYFGVNEDIWKWNNGSPEVFYDATVQEYSLGFLAQGPLNLIAGYRFLNSSNPDRNLVLLNENGVEKEIISNCVYDAYYATQEENGRIWIGDKGFFIRYLNANANSCELLEYPGPPSNDNYRMEHDGNSLWVAAGTLTPNLSPKSNSQGLYRYQNGSWTIYNRVNNSTVAGRDGQSFTFDDLLDIIGIAIDPANRKVWIGSFYEGTFSLDPETDETALYDEVNSTLEFATGEVAGRIRVGNPVADGKGNVFFPNSRAENGNILHVRTADGQWAALGGSCNSNEAFTVAIDNSGFAWVLHGTVAGNGISVIDTKNTLLDPSDDVCRDINSGNSNLINNEVRSIAVDLDGKVWIGTSTGLMVFECGGSVFDADICQGKTIAVFDENNNGGLLLETEDCLSITIDGANRKWVGTTGGAYLLSADGTEQLAFFDENNSPLLDNMVRDIAINPKDGTVFFGTENGIISYRSNATQAESVNQEQLKIFPNPVEPGYDGPIAIDGLVRDATVKITDLSGKLVYETNALGGQAIWNGTDYNGRRVQSGVYLVFASTNSRLRFGSPTANNKLDTALGKIVFLR